MKRRFKGSTSYRQTIQRLFDMFCDYINDNIDDSEIVQQFIDDIKKNIYNHYEKLKEEIRHENTLHNL